MNIDEVAAAAVRLGDRVRRTPVLSAGPGLWFKLELAQHAGSFKTRGMLNRMLRAAETGLLPAAGVVTASGGNAGLAAAYAARELGVPAEVYVPETAPAPKVAKLATLGARVVPVGREYAEAAEAATARSAQTGALYCHAYDDPDMVTGNGTLGRELLAQVPDGIDTVVVAVGGGGLIAGTIAALPAGVRVVAAEPVTACALHEALRAGGPVDVAVSGVAVDSLGARRAGRIAYDLASAAGVTSVLVEDKAIVDARRRLWDDFRLVVEHGTATAYAVLTSGAYRPADGERVAVLLCGANTDPADLA